MDLVMKQMAGSSHCHRTSRRHTTITPRKITP